ncbi:Lectin-like protein BA14k precursor [Aminobacter sp. MSH1]|uniref:BA14K family protein n=1 Tax=Aminobacter sp. MSH1 TaxID=374606 RepID=UPI000D3345B2|nr:BA14K family protein [Aminobacter sp. MSH1]AWC23403.1 Lectin-like protein BA14k precursor [Aminobacter sp. MSH1]
MKLSSFARSGLVALGLVTGLPLAASAGPINLGQVHSTAPLAVPNVIPAQSHFCPPGTGCYARRDGWRGDRGRHGNWRGDRWRDDWRWRNRPHRRHWRGGTGIYLNFGIPAYRYYEPRYYQPRYVQPRRVYRGGLSSVHVRWCYDRYRSYRAWDNTFQPYNGPREQCWSPYS